MILRLIQAHPFKDGEFGENLANVSNKFAATADRGFKFQKRSQYFIRPHNETLSAAAMRVSNPDRPAFTIHR